MKTPLLHLRYCVVCEEWQLKDSVTTPAQLDKRKGFNCDACADHFSLPTHRIRLDETADEELPFADVGLVEDDEVVLEEVL